MRVSIDGDTALHDAFRGSGTFAKAREEVFAFKDAGAWVGINTVVFPATVLKADAVIACVGELGANQWALITPVPEGSAAGEPWLASEIVYSVMRLFEKVRHTNYSGSVKIWNFIGTPHTSVLIKSNGELVIAGVRSDDHHRLGSIDNYNFDDIASAIDLAESTNEKCFFSWAGWH